MLLGISLMLEMSRRGGAQLPLLDDCSVQARYCLDAPDEVQDGVEWWQDPEFTDVRGPVPRFVSIRRGFA